MRGAEMTRITEKRPYITVQPYGDGLYRATSPWSEGLYADGTTPAEAENLLLELLEIRIEDIGPIGHSEPIELDPDVSLPEEEV